MAQSYEPYGDVLSSFGEVSSSYGYAGEWTDATGLQYLRARYLDTGVGRFISRDTWGGDYYRPLSLNRWMYVEGNPITRVDPSGMFYNRNKAAAWAMDWDHHPGIHPSYDIVQYAPKMFEGVQCTLFASSVLYEGGIRDTLFSQKKTNGTLVEDELYWDIETLMPGGWYDNDELIGDYETWYSTPKFYEFVTKRVGRVVLSYNSPPQYNDELVYGINSPIDENWESQLRSIRGIVQPGDLVFYSNGFAWTHVAVVVGWNLPTSFSARDPDLAWNSSGNLLPAVPGINILKFLRCPNGLGPLFSDIPIRPIVVERSGYIDYDIWRSLDNTFKKSSKIEIVHIENQ